MATKKKAAKKKETLSGRMLVQKFPKASQEKHLLRGFSICGGGTDDLVSPAVWRPGGDARHSTSNN